MKASALFAGLGTIALISLGCATRPADRAASPAADVPPAASAPAPLFPADGVPSGWVVRGWSDVSQPAPPEAVWKVDHGVLRGGNPRGTWLVSERDFGDFTLEFEFRLGERGHSGVGLRFPPAGEPAFEGLEVQLVDPRYYGPNYAGQPWEYTGALHKALAPTAQLYRPLEWNRCSIVCRGPRVSIRLNGEPVLDVNLDEQTQAPPQGRPLAERPRRGRIGFQELSRAGGQVEIRDARILVVE